jgi:hypothetical protein
LLLLLLSLFGGFDAGEIVDSSGLFHHCQKRIKKVMRGERGGQKGRRKAPAKQRQNKKRW